MNKVLLVYFLALGSSIFYSNWIITAIVLVIGMLLLACHPIYKNNKKQTIRTQIKQNIHTININKAAWWEFEELPNISRVQAKKMVWIRKHNGPYTSKEDFYNKNLINDNEQKILNNLIYM